MSVPNTSKSSLESVGGGTDVLVPPAKFPWDGREGLSSMLVAADVDAAVAVRDREGREILITFSAVLRNHCRVLQSETCETGQDCPSEERYKDGGGLGILHPPHEVEVLLVLLCYAGVI